MKKIAFIMYLFLSFFPVVSAQDSYLLDEKFFEGNVWKDKFEFDSLKFFKPGIFWKTVIYGYQVFEDSAGIFTVTDNRVSFYILPESIEEKVYDKIVSALKKDDAVFRIINMLYKKVNSRYSLNYIYIWDFKNEDFDRELTPEEKTALINSFKINMISPAIHKDAVLKISDEYFDYRYTLTLDKGESYFRQFNNAAENLQITIGNINALSLNGKAGITTENVKIRKAPNIGAETLKVTVFEYESDPEEETPGKYTEKTLGYLPNGTSITIFARTTEKMKVQKWENYWYYVKYASGTPNEPVDYEPPIQGWVFGEFVDIYP